MRPARPTVPASISPSRRSTTRVAFGREGSDWKHADTDGHGTHVAGIAAGNGEQGDACTRSGIYVGVAPDADLVIVKALDISGAGFVSDSSAALRYIVDFAASVSKPVVVNISFGHHVGAHDGTHALEEAINTEIFNSVTNTQRPGIVVVKSAGNDGAKDVHNAGNIAASSPLAITFRVPPSPPALPNRRRDRIDIWYDLLSSIDIRIQLPDGNISGTASPSPTPTLLPAVSGHTIVVSSQVAMTGSLKNNITVSITPPAGGTMQTGPWQLLLQETAGNATAVNVWIDVEEKDGSPTFCPPGVAAGTTAAFRTHSISIPGYARRDHRRLLRRCGWPAVADVSMGSGIARQPNRS